MLSVPNPFEEFQNGETKKLYRGAVRTTLWSVKREPPTHLKAPERKDLLAAKSTEACFDIVAGGTDEDPLYWPQFRVELPALIELLPEGDIYNVRILRLDVEFSEQRLQQLSLEQRDAVATMLAMKEYRLTQRDSQRKGNGVHLDACAAALHDMRNRILRMSDV